MVCFPILSLFSARNSSLLPLFLLLQIVNVLGITLGGSIINTIEEIIDDPGSIIDLLATSLPPQATFFMNYIMLNALSVFSGSLLRLGKLIVAWIKMKLAVTNRQKRDAWLPGAKCDESSLSYLSSCRLSLSYSPHFTPLSRLSLWYSSHMPLSNLSFILLSLFPSLPTALLFTLWFIGLPFSCYELTVAPS